MRSLPMPRFWKVLAVASKHASLPAIARAWAGVDEAGAPPAAEVTPEEMNELREIVG